MSILARGGVVDVIHGVEVRDPYRWLEDRSLAKTERWIKRQNQLSDQYFSQNRFYAPLKKIVSEALSVEVIDQASRVGNTVFLRKQQKGQEQAAIWVRKEGESEDRLLVDPAAQGPNIAVNILRISSDGLLLAYSVRSCGADAMEINIADVTNGITLPDRLFLSYGRGFAFDAQGEGFYYCLEPLYGTADPMIKYHQFGDPSSSDVSLFSVPWKKHRRLFLLSSRGTLAAVVTDSAGKDLVQDLYLASEDNNTLWNPVYEGMRGRKWPLLAHGRVFLLDLEEAPNGSLIELREKDEPARVIIPECPNLIQRCLVVHNSFLISFLVDRQPRIERWTAEGEFIGALELPSGGSIEVLPACSEENSSLFFLHESYTKAPCLWEAGLSENRMAGPIRWTTPDEKSSAIVRECWYTSRDGTQIPMILLEPANRRRLGPQPTVLFGYGGFGAPELPRYSRLAKILLKLGATIARPGIRGGAEFGKEWHEAATRKQKQTAVDDFLAAAQWLFSENLADKECLAIMGSSNGGLLVAASAVQRPELFKAVVCTGPLTDMVRYERFDHASRWRDEYGTVEDAEEFRALLSYSPYHNVEDTVDYPAMLFVTGDADDRCNPAHVRKMAAALQERAAQQHPILVDHGQHWGHLPTLSLSERIDALSRKIAFLCEQIEIAIPEGVASDLFSD
jgi:prolyl oligopeptidase